MGQIISIYERIQYILFGVNASEQDVIPEESKSGFLGIEHGGPLAMLTMERILTSGVITGTWTL